MLRHLLILALCSLTSAFLSPSTRTKAPGGTNDSGTVPSTSTSLNIHKDILIIGSGLAGLSIAHHLSSAERQITILEREPPNVQRDKTVAGSFAAAGMLAPQSERMAAGPLLDVCLASRGMYGEWVKDVEGGAKDAVAGGDSDSARFLWYEVSCAVYMITEWIGAL